MKNQLKIGQTVFAEPCSNAARYSKAIKIFTIATLGNKYFTVKDDDGHIHRVKFSYETMQEVSEYATNWKIYLSMKEIQDRFDKPKFIKSITDKLNNLSVEELISLNESL